MRFPAGLTARQVAELVGGEFVGTSDVRLAGVAPLAGAGPGDLVYLTGADGAAQLPGLRADAVLLERPLRDAAGGPSVRIVVDDAVAAIEHLAAAVVGTDAARAIHPTARIGRGARWDGRLSVGPHSVVGKNVRLGRDCTIGAGAVIEDHAALGDDCHIGHDAVVHAGTVLGRGVVIGPGARVGGVGFGFRRVGEGHVRVPHLGGCVIGDGVEVGANTTIDRGVVDDTVVGDGTKIDNLVQVAHNVQIGKRCIIMAQVGIAGSVAVGDDVMLAGQAGLADHLRIGSGARVAAQSGVIGDVPPHATVSGYPARGHRSVLRQAVALGRLTPLVASLERLVARNE